MLVAHLLRNTKNYMEYTHTHDVTRGQVTVSDSVAQREVIERHLRLWVDVFQVPLEALALEALTQRYSL